MTQLNEIALGYDNIVLNHPKLSTVTSRSNCDTSVSFGGNVFDLPVIPANMRCTINPELGIQMMTNNMFHVLHRFNSSNFDEIEHYNNLRSKHSRPPYIQYTSISVGVKEEDYGTIIRLKRNYRKIEYITIDVAHGHSVLVFEMIQRIKKMYPDSFVIAGNITTPQAVIDLQNAGADAVKVGIGPGKACTTYLQTGYMSPMFTAVQRCAEVAKVPIIADGGIRSNGDIVKALVAGASMVMIGSMFAQLTDSPAKMVLPKWNWQNTKASIRAGLIRNRTYRPPVFYKEFFGSASEHNKDHKQHIEGTKLLLPGIHMTYLEKMAEIKQSLQSAISYSGGIDLSCLSSVKYDIIS